MDNSNSRPLIRCVMPTHTVLPISPDILGFAEVIAPQGEIDGKSPNQMNDTSIIGCIVSI